MLKQMACVAVVGFFTFAQDFTPPPAGFRLPSPTVSGSGPGSVRSLDNENRAAVYCHNPNSVPDRNATRSSVRARLGDFFSSFDIGYYDLDAAQYETLCGMFGLGTRPNQPMLVLYHDQKAAQIPYDETIDIVPEFRKLGWKPLKERLDAFLELNPNNQDALAILFSMMGQSLNNLIVESRINALDPSLMAMARSQLPDFVSPDSDTLPNLIKTMEAINKAGKLDWMSSQAGSSTFSILQLVAAAPPILSDSREFQRELDILLAQIESELVRYPFTPNLYSRWVSFANMAKNPDPSRLLSQINFPPASKSAPNNLYTLALPFINNAVVTMKDGNIENVEADASKGFKFLIELEEWMEAQSNEKGDMFDEALLRLAIEKTRLLIQYKQYNEIENYLEGRRYILGENWPKLVTEIKTPRVPSQITNLYKNIPNLNKVEEILALPALEESEKRFDGLLVLHNFSKASFDKLHSALTQQKVHFYTRQDRRLANNYWILKNRNVQVAQGSILPLEDEEVSGISEEVRELMDTIRTEEIKNLNLLAQFIRLNPENYDAMDMYCQEAEKILPNEEIEAQMLAYAAKTGTPPSLQAYSKMTKGDDWSRIASRVIAEGLVNLKDAPSFFMPSSPTGNPWIRLSRWEDLDIQKNAIDWHGFFKDPSDFWYKPMYYMNRMLMSEIVFVKYIAQADRARDWRQIVEACQTRFDGTKSNCRDEQILNAWNKAEEMIRTPNLL